MDLVNSNREAVAGREHCSSAVSSLLIAMADARAQSLQSDS